MFLSIVASVLALSAVGVNSDIANQMSGYLPDSIGTVIASSKNANAPIISGYGTISNVVDGDTFWIRPDSNSGMAPFQELTKGKNIRNGKVKIRLLAVDTEESVHRTASKNTAFGRQTSKIVKSEVTGAKISYHCSGAGRYGRPLCSFSVGDIEYGLSLISRGYTPYYTKYGKHPWYDEAYKIAEREAKAGRLGIWK